MLLGYKKKERSRKRKRGEECAERLEKERVRGRMSEHERKEEKYGGGEGRGGVFKW